MRTVEEEEVGGLDCPGTEGWQDEPATRGLRDRVESLELNLSIYLSIICLYVHSHSHHQMSIKISFTYILLSCLFNI